MSRQDELIAMSQHQAAQQAMRLIQDDAVATAQAYQTAIQNGDTQDAAQQQRTYLALVEEAQRLAAAIEAQQPQQQPPQTEGGFTPVQVGFLQANPEYAKDRRKFAEIFASHHRLMQLGMDPNSPEYASALNMSAGKPIPDVEKPLTADEVCEITGIDADTYNKNAADLLTLKSLGHYRDGR